MSLIYLDNAATSWPKPEAVIEAMERYTRLVGGSPGRSGHRLSVDAARIIYSCRDNLAGLFSIEDPLRIVFTKNATEALNIAIYGLLKPGDHVVTTGMEHNSVMRPLRYLQENGVELCVTECDEKGILDPDDLKKNIRKNTRAIYLTHASNVTGTIMPLIEAGNIAAEHGLCFCVDAAQTAGAVKIDVQKMNINLLAFTGHKSLFGPQGTGGLYIDKMAEKILTPIMRGGTGSYSENENQPDFLPDKFESGTPNTVGIAGLEAGVRYIAGTGIDTIIEHEAELTGLFVSSVKQIKGVKLYGIEDTGLRTSVVSINIDGMSSSDVSMKLDEEFNIMSRPGLQCSPSAHKTINAFPGGTVRLGIGYFNTKDDILSAVHAVDIIASGNM